MVFSKCIVLARADVLCFVSFWDPLVLHLLMLIVCFRLALRAALTGIINKYSSRQAARRQAVGQRCVYVTFTEI